MPIKFIIGSPVDNDELGWRVAGAILRENEGPDWMRTIVVVTRGSRTRRLPERSSNDRIVV